MHGRGNPEWCRQCSTRRCVGAAPGAAGEWGTVAGADAAVAVEVVEHLDPRPLAALGPALLGALRPQVAVVTTPNVEYNVVLRAIAGGPLTAEQGGGGDTAPPLRNRDHRFEWYAFQSPAVFGIALATLGAAPRLFAAILKAVQWSSAQHADCHRVASCAKL